ncbi:MAG TPA: pantoate--beta-alanine ligase [Chitinophagaceae bacterium]|nr:pantoate--beta-alanine ligase [Chitinophagaceae bacterium]
MIIFNKPRAIHSFLKNKRSAKNRTGFVPTMGALHPGHISLIEAAKKENDEVISSIFVNPTQFNDPEDFKKYPITPEKDILSLEIAGCDVLFLPSVSDIYPAGINNLSHYDLGFLETILEGKYRPGHFQGVCQVVHRLLEIVLPNNLYLGQKDYQQCLVIQKLIRLIGFGDKIRVSICPTLREDDGLAMSSRNTRLNEEERKKANAIFKTLLFIKSNLYAMKVEQLKKAALSSLTEKGFKVDYVEVADATTLQLVDAWDGKQKIIALAAAFLGNVRLIDNMVLNP